MLTFYDLNEIADEKMKFAVMISLYENKWVLCKHKQRDTWEIPGGTREDNEVIDACAKRELYEETGASKYTMERSFIFEANGSYAMVYIVHIEEFSQLPESEIGEIEFFEDLDISWTYPNMQPQLLEYYSLK